MAGRILLFVCGSVYSCRRGVRALVQGLFRLRDQQRIRLIFGDSLAVHHDRTRNE